MAQRRLNTTLVGGFALLALVLAAVGLYGVVSQLVSQRTHEIGVRMALGANWQDVQRLVIGQEGSAVIVGIALGLTGSVLTTRLLASMLYGVSPLDPLTLMTVPVLLVGVALLASWLPARRATRVDSLIALRAE